MLGGISPPAWSICRLTLDHHLTTTVQRYYKMSEKPVVTTNNGLFLVSGSTVQNQQILRFNASLDRPVVVLRPGRPEVRILPVALKKRIAMYFFCNALFVLILCQNSFSSISSAASVNCPFARRSFRSWFKVVLIRCISSTEKLALLSAERALIFSISRTGFSVLCPSAFSR